MILSHNLLLVLHKGNARLVKPVHEEIHLLLSLILHLDHLEDELDVLYLMWALAELPRKLGNGIRNILGHTGTLSADL